MKEQSNNTSEVSTRKPFIKNKLTVILLAVVAILWVIFSLNFAVVQVTGDSMVPTLTNGQLLFSQKTFLNLKRFDIVVCVDDMQTLIIKRIIGLPGDTIEYKDNRLYINDEYVEDEYGVGSTDTDPITLDDNCYYCLGDNRGHSRDSRIFGQISRDNIVAKIIEGGGEPLYGKE